MIAEGGPLQWLDTLLGARHERLEADVAEAQDRATAAEAVAQAATEAQRAAASEAETLRHELGQVREACQASEQACRRLERELAAVRRQAEQDLWTVSRRLGQERADRTWDLVRRLEAALGACQREHGGGHA